MWNRTSPPRGNRRSLLKGAAAGAAAVALAPALSACAGSGAAATGSPASSAAPAVVNAKTVLNFAPNWQGATWNKTAWDLNQEFFDTNYPAKHPGVRVVVHNGSVQGGASAQITASIAGSGYMDVFQDCCNDLATLNTSGFLQPLDDYLKRDNIDPAIWPKGHVEVLTWDGKLKALPAYDGPCVIFYRQDLLDQLGFPYPDPAWDYKAATALWTSCVGKNKQGGQRGGCSIFDSGYSELINWWIHAWGGLEMSPDRKTALTDSPQVQDMGTYVQDNWKTKALVGRSDPTSLVREQCVFKQSGGWELLPAALELGNKYKWDILPVPKWPAGRSTFLNIDYYALNAVSKNLDAAWDLMKYVCAEPDYQRFQMQTTLVQPCLLSLYDEWETIAVSTAPVLNGKAIKWYKDAATGGYAWPTLFFEYQASQAQSLIDTWMGQVWNGKVSSQLGLTQMTQQINALQQAGQSEQAASVDMAKKFPVSGPEVAAAVPAGF